MKTNAFYTVAAILVTAYQVVAKPAEGCLQNYTVAVGDGCDTVASRFQLPMNDFFTMNPGLHHSTQHMCDNLDVGKPFCVCMKAPCPVSDSSTTPATTTLAPANADMGNTPSTEKSTTTANSGSTTTTLSTANTPSNTVAPSTSTSTPGSTDFGSSKLSASSGPSKSSADHLTSLHQAAVMAAGAATAIMVVFL